MERKLNIGDAINYGFDRLTTRGGAKLLAAYVLVIVVSGVSYLSLIMGTLSDSAATGQDVSFTPPLDLPVAVSGGLLVLSLVVGTVLAIVAMRAMYADINDVPTTDHTRRLLRTVGVLLVVGIITNIAVTIGTAFLIVPGIFLAVSLYFAPAAVMIEDAGIIESLERSWELTAGNRFRLFALGIILSIGGSIVGGFFFILSIFVPIVGALLYLVTLGALILFGTGVQIGAYRQLAGDTESADAGSW